MRIDLETPYNPGDNDPGQSYPHCKIVLLTHSPVARSTLVVYEFGSEDANQVWLRGPGAPTSRHVDLSDEDLAALSTPVVLAHAFQGLELLCYQCLVQTNLVSGAIVDDVAAEKPPQEEPKP